MYPFMENVLNMILLNVILFSIGISGLVLNKNNILITIMSIEILLLSVNLNFIVFSIYLDDIIGQIFVIFILAIAASETSIGLSILMKYFQIQGSAKYNIIKFM